MGSPAPSMSFAPTAAPPTALPSPTPTPLPTRAPKKNVPDDDDLALGLGLGLGLPSGLALITIAYLAYAKYARDMQETQDLKAAEEDKAGSLQYVPSDTTDIAIVNPGGVDI